MSIAELRRTYTPEELLALPDANNYELVDGELVERHMSVRSSLVEGRVYFLIAAHCNGTGADTPFPSSLGYQCFPDHPKQIRKPDVSFVAAHRLTPDLFAEGYCPVAPDLVVEVVSPGDAAEEVMQKVDDYYDAGVKLVWVVYPELRFVHVHRPNGSVERRDDDELLDGETVLPGFQCPVKDLFPEPNTLPKP